MTKPLANSGLLLVTFLLMLQLLVGCAPPKVPIPTLRYPTETAKRQRNLLVLVRGLGADNAVFEKKGIIQEIRNRNLPFDVIAPDVHYGYYKSRTFEKRFKEDIIDPARQQGYEQIWLAGFSMGGLGSLLYVRSHPNDIDGILLTSPFLGWRAIQREIRRAGGVAAWQQTSDDPKDWQRLLWTWIKTHDPATVPPIWLGHGENDILAAGGPPLLATTLPPERVFTVPGNHTVSTFKKIFLRHLDTLARESQQRVKPKREQ
ncbi:MAG: alpha/beta hydrolase [Holophaga sp.]|nr:alpha/beta hydrolase [Holophaga sp.]